MILVTGATGLVGSFIVKELIRQNIPFKAMTRGTFSPVLEEYRDQIEWVEADILNIPSLEIALKNVNTVIHGAGLISFRKKDRNKLLAVNMEGTANVVNLCLKNNVERLIYISSTGALPKLVKSGTVDENGKWQDRNYNNYYGYTKYLGELEIWRGQEEGLKCTIVNPSVILGPGDISRSSTRLFNYVLEEKKFYTDGIINYVDVRNLVEIILRLIQEDITGEQYIVSAGHVEYKQFFYLMGRYLNKKPPSIKVKPIYVQIFAWFEGIRAKLTGKEPLISRETASQTQLMLTFDNSKVRKRFSFEFKPLEETIRWCCKEFKKRSA